MDIKTRLEGNAIVLTVTGEVDMQTSPKLREALRKAIDKKPEKVIVDLAAVAYIDSSGLATLVEGLQKTKKYGSHLLLVGINDNIRDIFDLSGLNRVFDMKKDEAEALES